MRALTLSLRLAAEQRADAGDAEFFHGAAGLGGLPSLIGGQSGLQGRPVGFSQFGAVAQKRLHGGSQQRGDGGGMGRIKARF
jgi:hypothetical protein